MMWLCCLLLLPISLAQSGATPSEASFGLLREAVKRERAMDRGFVRARVTLGCEKLDALVREREEKAAAFCEKVEALSAEERARLKELRQRKLQQDRMAELARARAAQQSQPPWLRTQRGQISQAPQGPPDPLEAYEVWRERLEEFAGDHLVEYAWRGTDRWYIDIQSADGTSVRRMARNGGPMELGGKMRWDAGFLSQLTAPDDTGKFVALTRPYFMLARCHLFPMTHGRLPGIEETLIMSAPGVDPHMKGLDPGVVPIDIAPGHISDTYWIDTNHGHVVVGGHLHGRTELLRHGGLVEVGDGLWVPSWCEYRFRSGPDEYVFWRSELLVDECMFGTLPGDADFALRTPEDAEFVSLPAPPVQRLPDTVRGLQVRRIRGVRGVGRPSNWWDEVKVIAGKSWPFVLITFLVLIFVVSPRLFFRRWQRRRRGSETTDE